MPNPFHLNGLEALLATAVVCATVVVVMALACWTTVKVVSQVCQTVDNAWANVRAIWGKR